MPRQQRSRNGSRVRADLLEADLDTGFVLVGLAEFGQDARRALAEAEVAYMDGQRRLLGLGAGAVRRFGPQFELLRWEIERVKSGLGSLP